MDTPFPYFPLQNGLLTGKYDYDTATRSLTGAGKIALTKRHLIASAPWHALKKFKALSQDLGHKPSQVALAWLLHQPGVDLVIPGATTPAQLEENAHAAYVQLSDSVLDKLAALFPSQISGRPGETT